MHIQGKASIHPKHGGGILKLNFEHIYIHTHTHHHTHIHSMSP